MNYRLTKFLCKLYVPDNHVGYWIIIYFLSAVKSSTGTPNASPTATPKALILLFRKKSTLIRKKHASKVTPTFNCLFSWNLWFYLNRISVTSNPKSPHAIREVKVSSKLSSLFIYFFLISFCPKLSYWISINDFVEFSFIHSVVLCPRAMKSKAIRFRNR